MSEARGFEFRFAVDRAHPSFAGHFPGRPIVPGVLLLDRVLAGIADQLDRRVSELCHVKFAAVLLPDETVIVDCEATGDTLVFSARTQRADDLVTLASGRLRLAGQPAQSNTRPVAGSTAA